MIARIIHRGNNTFEIQPGNYRILVHRPEAIAQMALWARDNTVLDIVVTNNGSEIAIMPIKDLKVIG